MNAHTINNDFAKGRGTFAHLIPPVEPTLDLLAIRAVKAKVVGDSDTEEATEAFRQAFHAQTGISPFVLSMLIGEGILPARSTLDALTARPDSMGGL